MSIPIPTWWLALSLLGGNVTWHVMYWFALFYYFLLRGAEGSEGSAVCLGSARPISCIIVDTGPARPCCDANDSSK